jgi:hypothetical protein
VLGHPFVVFASTFPCSFFALFTLAPRFAQLWDERGRRLLQALHCWIWPNLLFWSVIPEHAPRHSFPLFPGVAGLAALAWIAWLTGRTRWPIPRIATAKLFVTLLAGWLFVKAAYVHAWVPVRDGRANDFLGACGFNRKSTRDPHGKAEQIAALVPADRPLYLFRLKDEGIMFCYGRCHPDGAPERVVRRLKRLEDLPSPTELVYCIVSDDEWAGWNQRRPAEVLLRSHDQQGDPIVLVAVRTSPDR